MTKFTCICDSGPYVGAHLAGTPDCCEMCGRLTQFQLDEYLQDFIKEELEVLERIPCQFWACDGHLSTPVNMQTCHVCWRIWELRQRISSD